MKVSPAAMIFLLRTSFAQTVAKAANQLANDADTAHICVYL